MAAAVRTSSGSCQAGRAQTRGGRSYRHAAQPNDQLTQQGVADVGVVEAAPGVQPPVGANVAARSAHGTPGSRSTTTRRFGGETGSVREEIPQGARPRTAFPRRSREPIVEVKPAVINAVAGPARCERLGDGNRSGTGCRESAPHPSRLRRACRARCAHTSTPSGQLPPTWTALAPRLVPWPRGPIERARYQGVLGLQKLARRPWRRASHDRRQIPVAGGDVWNVNGDVVSSLHAQ